MFTSRIKRLLPVVPTAMLALTACSTNAARPGGTSSCMAEAAQRLVGKSKPSDNEAKALTGARIVRQIAPGQAVTFDFREDRVTITTNPATGRVVSAHCG